MRYLKSNFSRNILLVIRGTAFAQLVTIIVSPVLTRIYSPHEYGYQTFFITILGFLSIVGSLKYEQGIPIAENEDEAFNLLYLSILIIVIGTVVLYFLLFFLFYNDFLDQFSGKFLSSYQYLIPLGFFFVGIYNVFSQWAIRDKSFRTISQTKVNQALTQNFSKILMGLMKVGPNGLIIGSILGQAMGIKSLAKPLIQNRNYYIQLASMTKIKCLIKRYIKFPFYFMPSQLLNNAGIQLPVIFISAFYGSKEVGFYGLAYSIVSLPMSIIGTSIADVFYGEVARIGKSKPEMIKHLSNKLFKRLLLIGFFPFLIIFLFGPYLFRFVFGGEWGEAGIYARLISLLIFSRLVFTPVSNVFLVYEKQKEILLIDSLRVLLVLSVFLWGHFGRISVYTTLGIYSISMTFIYAYTYFFANKLINDQIKKLIKIND